MVELILGAFMILVGGSLLHTTPVRKLAPAILLLAWGGMFLFEGIKAMMPLIIKFYGL